MNATTPQNTPILTTPTLWRRMCCWMYEGLLLFGVVFLTSFVFSIVTQTRHALDNRHLQQVVLFLVLGCYFVGFWSKGLGQTLAMKTWHIRVVDGQGQPLTLRRAMLRYVLCWMWFVPPLVLLSITEHWQQNPLLASLLTVLWVVFWALLGRILPGGQFLHDVLAGTRLVYQAPPKRAEATRKWWQL